MNLKLKHDDTPSDNHKDELGFGKQINNNNNNNNNNYYYYYYYYYYYVPSSNMMTTHRLITWLS